jgi:hypothetical protein
MNREPWRLVVRGGRVVLYRGRKCVDAMDAEQALQRGSALNAMGQWGMRNQVDVPDMERSGWRLRLCHGLVYVYRAGPAKCLDVMTAEMACLEGRDLILVGMALRATAAGSDERGEGGEG